MILSSYYYHDCDYAHDHGHGHENDHVYHENDYVYHENDYFNLCQLKFNHFNVHVHDHDHSFQNGHHGLLLYPKFFSYFSKIRFPIIIINHMNYPHFKLLQ